MTPDRKAAALAENERLEQERESVRREALLETLKIIEGPWTFAGSKREMDLLDDFKWLAAQSIRRLLADQGQAGEKGV